MNMVFLTNPFIGRCVANAKLVATLPNFTKVGFETKLNSQYAFFKSASFLPANATAVFSKEIIHSLFWEANIL